MAIFEFGEYKIDIDVEKTKKYFEEIEMNECQANRNFQKYVNELMNDNEKAFFASLHIDLSKVDICYGLLSKNKKWTCNMQTYIIGEFLSYPETDYMTLDEVREQGIEILKNIESNVITVGNFLVHIYTPDEYDNISDDYKNSIYVELDVIDIPWLLDEKCKDKEASETAEFLYYHFKYAIHFIPNLIRKIKERNIEKKTLIKELEKLKGKCNFSYEILSNSNMKEYKKLWVNNIFPRNADEETREKVYEVCLPHKKYETFLWNIFSFNIVESLENPTKEFEKIRKNNCTLILESCNHTCVKIKNAEHLTDRDIIDLCNNVAGWCDFVITADDFAWTYSRTHEDGWCGPYFYRKDDNSD